MNASANKVYGLMAQFSDSEDLLGATRRAYAEGYRRMDAYSPFPIEGLAEALKKSGQDKTITVKADGKTFQAIVRIDTPQEVLYYQHGGILQYVLRQLLSGKEKSVAGSGND